MTHNKDLRHHTQSKDLQRRAHHVVLINVNNKVEVCQQKI